MRKLLFYWWLYLQLKATFPFLAIIFTLRAYKSNVTWCSVYRYFKTYFTLPSFNLLSLHFYTTGKISSFTLSEIKYSVDIAFLLFSILLSFSSRNIKGIDQFYRILFLIKDIPYHIFFVNSFLIVFPFAALLVSLLC